MAMKTSSGQRILALWNNSHSTWCSLRQGSPETATRWKLKHLLWHQKCNFHFCKTKFWDNSHTCFDIENSNFMFAKTLNSLSWQSGYRHFGQREEFSSSWREKVRLKYFFCNSLLVNISKLSVRTWLHFIPWNTQDIGRQGSLVCRVRPQQGAEDGFLEFLSKECLL